MTPCTENFPIQGVILFLLFFIFVLQGVSFLLLTQLFDALFLALDMGPWPAEALVLTAPFDQRIEGESQTEEVQQSVQQGIQRDECIQCTDHRHHTACLQKEQAILAAVFLKVLRLDGTAALIAPDTGIFMTE